MSSETIELEDLERLAPGNWPVVYDFDWRDLDDPREFREEWQGVLDCLDRKGRKAQCAGAAAQYKAAAAILRNRFYVYPNTTGVVVARVVDCLEQKAPGEDPFHAEVVSCIREAMHEAFRKEKVWQDPRYRED